MPISLRSSTKLVKADSMAAVSVLLSTTRKFFCASAPAEMCCCMSDYPLLCLAGLKLLTPMPARRSPVTESWLLRQCTAVGAPGGWCASHLVADDGEELPVLVISLVGHPDGRRGRWMAVAWRVWRGGSKTDEVGGGCDDAPKLPEVRRRRPPGPPLKLRPLSANCPALLALPCSCSP